MNVRDGEGAVDSMAWSGVDRQSTCAVAELVCPSGSEIWPDVDQQAAEELLVSADDFSSSCEPGSVVFVSTVGGLA